MQAVFAAVAAVLGILIGYWLRSASAKSECAAAAGEKAQLDQRASALTADVAALRSEIAQLRETSERRAGFEQLCSERQGVIERLSNEREQSAAALQAKVDTERTLTSRISALETELRNERQNMADKVALLEAARKTLADQFQTLATDILEQKSKTFAESSQKDLGNLLSPLREQIQEFRKRVEEAQSDSKLGVNTLQTLVGNLNTMNQQLTAEAHNLTTALRGSAKSQGDWGEFILRDLLENSGLREGEQYTFQQRFTYSDDEDSRQTAITDVVLKLPGERHLIVDSKVSLDAYTDSVNAKDDLDRRTAVKRHLASIRNHIAGLAAKRYQELLSLDTLDFVIMFVPIEPAFFEALRADDRLWADAYKAKVLLVGPTTLLFVVKIVHELWTQELKAQNYKEVMDRGSQLYDKFVGFLADLECIGNSLNQAQDSFAAARKKLSTSDTSLVHQVERLRALGVTPKVRKIRKKATAPAVIPQRWLDGSAADGPDLFLASAVEPTELDVNDSDTDVTLSEEVEQG